MNEIQQISVADFTKTAKKGGYVTSDGNIFDLNPAGKTFATSHASGLADKSVLTFDEKGEQVIEKSDAEVREIAMKSLSGKYSEGELSNLSTHTLTELAKQTGNSGEGGQTEIDIDKMNKAQLIDLLVSLDPTVDPEYHTKAKTKNDDLKDLIEIANSLTGLEIEHLSKMALAFELSEEQLSRLEAEDLKNYILHKRDGLELAESVSNKINDVKE